MTEFSGVELIKLAVQIEKNGNDFFTTIAHQVKKDNTRYIFVYLAQEEERHVAAFQKMLHMDNSPITAESDSDTYVQTLARDHVFTQKNAGKKAARKVKNAHDAIEMGIQFEEQSITYFEAIKAYVPQSEHYLVDAIIAEERTHLLKLSELKQKL